MCLRIVEQEPLRVTLLITGKVPVFCAKRYTPLRTCAILAKHGGGFLTRQEIIDYCLTYSDAYEDYPFDEIIGPEAWTVMRHRSNKKTFALIYERNGLCVNLKCEPMRADFLRGAYAGVTPGYHMNKTHWNTVRLPSDVPEDALRDMIDLSFELTAPKKNAKFTASEKA